VTIVEDNGTRVDDVTRRHFNFATYENQQAGTLVGCVGIVELKPGSVINSHVGVAEIKGGAEGSDRIPGQSVPDVPHQEWREKGSKQANGISKRAQPWMSRWVYRLVDVDLNMFRVDEKSGNIFTLSPLDRERKGVYYLTVTATLEPLPLSGGQQLKALLGEQELKGMNNLTLDSDKTTFTQNQRYFIDEKTLGESNDVTTVTSLVTVHVADVNDNAPMFVWPSSLNNTLIGRREEIDKAGYRLGVVTAVDADVGDNARLIYSVQSDEGNCHHFSQALSAYFTVCMTRSCRTCLSKHCHVCVSWVVTCEQG